MEKPIKIRLHVLSPIHIGCDDVYEPTSFVIDEEKKKLIEFDPLEFVKSLNPQELAELSKTATTDNLLAIFKTIKRLYKPSIKGREVEITDYLVSHYKKILGMGTYEKNAVINQFTINRTAYKSFDNMPYIPGSSIKGSIRTAYLNMLAKEKGITQCWKMYLGKNELKSYDEIYKNINKGRNNIAEKLEEELLGGRFSSDPFSYVKVSDFLPLENVRTKIIYAINRKKSARKEETSAERSELYQIFEVIQRESVFEGVINLVKPLENLFVSLNDFYTQILQQDASILQNTGSDICLTSEVNRKFGEKIDEKAFVICLGRHSGAEAVTIEGNRLIRIMQGKDKAGKMRYEYKPYSTTIWLASDSPKPESNNGLLPFGWAVLELV